MLQRMIGLRGLLAAGLAFVFFCSGGAWMQAAPRLREAKAQEEAKAPDDKKKDDEKWDVADPPGPRREIPIDVSEGTWMSLDVSPDGKEIAFDLLGNIYAIPIDGGEAKALTSGIEWDMQPRYSPDGSYIAYTSDAGGGDNIWVMKRDGSDPKAVTKENYRLLNSPVWTPDSQYVAARKHFVSNRSLGAGEIWLYHRTGGGGLQMVKRPNDQKDLGEPAFSPDGRYLYYSLDSTPGSVFQYNKDPNGVIYTVRRLDRQTGDTMTLLRGAGGSIRPTPSPDGRTIAFVRRVRYNSVLYLHDLESGAEWPLYDGLDRDMQETWAIHGVYPSMAWTPDGGAIVFWASGHIQRIDVHSKEVETIPFHVKDKREVVEAVRFPQEVAPDNFDVKMLRWVQVSPIGDKVVYQALGHIYLRDLPDGTPHRLTAQNDHFEFYPSFSRDGSQIVYIGWDDDDLAAVRVAPASGGEGRAVTSEKGHYIEPVFSPDAQTIVYRKVTGGGVVSPLWSSEPGLYRIPAAGGEPLRIARTAFRPHFGADNDRVYYTAPAGGGKVRLNSVGLDGKEERTHLESANATEIRVSPDGKWVAFAERYHCYVAPFIATGQAVDIGPNMSAIPVRRVSKEAGEYLHWSGDSSRLHWALGPELYTRDLKDAFSFLEGAPDKLPEPVAEGRNISFSQAYDVPSGALAFHDARVVTMGDAGVVEHGTVLVRGNRIVAVGGPNMAIPSDAHVIEAAGHTIVPGFIDVHAHGGQGRNEIIPQQNPLHGATLAFGVTTVHDPSNDTSQIFAAGEMAKAGMIAAPRIYSTGTILYGAEGSFKAIVNNLDDARSHLLRMKAVGAFSVKSYNQPRREQRQQIIAAARELEMMVVPEGGSLFEHNMTMVVDGHTGVEHAIPVAKIYSDVLQLWPKTNVGYTPTLIVGYGGDWGENYWYQKTNVWENERLLTFVPQEEVDARSRRRTMVPDDEFNHIDIARACKQLLDAGGHIQVGAHGQREGLGVHWEMWMMGQGGMTPMEVLNAATLDGARYLGLDHDLGSIQAGKLADLVVLSGNPLQDLRQTESVVYTVVNGRIYDARTLNQLGNHPSRREPYFFQKEGPQQ